MSLRILLCEPGPKFSTYDVFEGLRDGLQSLDCEVIPYSLSTRWGRARSWLLFNYRRAKRSYPDIPHPTPADAIYQASIGAVEVYLRELPDWVLIVTASMFHPDAAIMLKRAGARVAVLLSESPYEDEPQSAFLRYVDVAFTNERSSVPYLRRFNPNTHYLPHAYRPERHHPGVDDPHAAAHDVVFVGTCFPERARLLAAVDWTGIDLGLYGNWKMLPARHKLRRYVRGALTDNALTAALYAKAKVGLNLYRQIRSWDARVAPIEYAESLNPRAYELAATGCFHLSERRAEVDEVFGNDVPTFATAKGLEAQIRHWLARDEERRAVAARLPALVAGQTWEARAATVADILAKVALPDREVVPA